MAGELVSYMRWHWLWVRDYLTRTWRAYAGLPRWQQIVLLAVTVALLVTPGPDELLMPALAAWLGRRARKML